MTAQHLGTVTLLFTDIEGSTKLLKHLGHRYAEALADHQRILRECFDPHGGREINTQGDSFFVAFARAGDGVASAIDAQLALQGHTWPDGAKVRVRMGLHSGEPRASGERYVRYGVHRAARAGRRFTRMSCCRTGSGLDATSRSSRSSRCLNMSLVEQLVDITGVEVVGHYRLRLTFQDGTVGDVDFAGRDWRGVFEPLRDPEFFARVTVDPEAGTISWPGGLDTAPEPLDEEARSHPVRRAAARR